jgi:hypothetical protein
MSTAGFDRAKIVELLTELGRRLSAKGVAGRLYVVGGAAMESRPIRPVPP